VIDIVLCACPFPERRNVANSAAALGMSVVGYDPTIDIDNAWNLPGEVIGRADSLESLLETCDYVSLHVPYMKATHHLLNSEMLALMKPNSAIINFARAELVDSEAMRSMYNAGTRTGESNDRCVF
jgi:D-3-phosphoglycerate dehydrogenase